MSILVVGGSGFIGRAVTARLASESQGTEVIATYASDAGFPAFARSIGVTPMQVDLRDADAARKLPDADVCVFAAGTSDHAISPRNSVTEPLGLVNLLEGFRGRMVLVSSGAVYFGHEGQVREDAPVAATFPYSLAKLVSEQHVLQAATQGALSGAAMLRVFYAFGPGERRTRLIPRVIERVRAGDKSFVVRGDGESFIDPLTVDDIARAVCLVAKRGARGVETYNLSGGSPTRVLDLVRLVASAAGSDIHVSCDGQPEVYPVRFWGDPARFHEAYGFEPTPLASALRDYANAMEQGSG